MSGLSHDAAARIIRRASQIDGPDRRTDHGPSADALRQAAAEVGISDGAMVRAIAEEQLRAELDLQDRTGDRICGPDRIIAFVEGPPNSMERVDRWMRRSAQLRRVPTATDVVLYERRTDALAQLQRGVRRARGATQLSRPPRLSVVSVPMGDRQLIGVVAELRRERLMATGLAVLVGIGGAIAAVVAAATSSPGFLALGPLALGIGVGIAIGRRESLGSAQRQLEGSVISAISREVPNSRASTFVDSAVETALDGITRLGARVRTERHADRAERDPCAGDPFAGDPCVGDRGNERGHGRGGERRQPAASPPAGQTATN